ncbi:MAG: hypothetical protein N2316_04595 [Spirochaetes bacterium]|nr:hypothetical protein [Spirochaetota bacterium]
MKKRENVLHYNHEHIAKLFKGLIFLFIGSIFSTPLYAFDAFGPFKFPCGTIGTSNPPFIWQDFYSERDARYNVKYHITLREKDNNNILTSSFVLPKMYQRNIYIANLPLTLKPGNYEFTIERIVDGKSVNSRYFYSYKYPVFGEFEIKFEKKREFEKLSDEKLVNYLMYERKNRLENGYNALFFVTSSSICLAAGIAIYNYTNFHIITPLLSAVCVISSIIGYGATSFYGYKYFQGKNELEKMLTKYENSSSKEILDKNRLCVSMSSCF